MIFFILHKINNSFNCNSKCLFVLFEHKSQYWYSWLNVETLKYWNQSYILFYLLIIYCRIGLHFSHFWTKNYQLSWKSLLIDNKYQCLMWYMFILLTGIIVWCQNELGLLLCEGVLIVLKNVHFRTNRSHY